jgi:hypothetical protein
MPKNKHFCTVSGKEIPEGRVEALIMLGVPPSRWTCVEHSTEKPKQGIFMGEHGSSEMKIVDKVYDDSVRSVFKSSDREETEETDPKAVPQSPVEPKPGFYTEKEINYYTDGEEVDGDVSSGAIKKLDS